MEWLCQCGKPVTVVELLWHWRDAADIGQRHGRYVCYRCRIGCNDCIPQQADKDYEYFPVKLNAHNKQALVGQVLAETVNRGPRGYVPKTDVQRALRTVRKQP
jgi:hypothetical protein